MIYRNVLKICAVSALGLSMQSAFADKNKEEEVAGIWYRAGYEEYYLVSQNNAELYKATINAESKAVDWCFSSESIPLAEFLVATNIQDDTNIEVDTGLLRDDIDDGPYTYKKVNTLPKACKNGGQLVAGEEGFDGDIVSDFELFWHSFNSFYPFFGLHDIDWNQEYLNLRNSITESTSAEELVETVAEVLESTEDTHLGIELNDEVSFSPLFRIRGFIEELYKSYESQEEFEDFFEFVFNQLNTELPQAMLDTYLNLAGEFNSSADDEVEVTYLWGDLSKVGYDNIGYLSVSSFAESEATLSQEKKAFEEAFSTLTNSDALIIDVRNNTGGSYNLALFLAGFLVDRPTHVFNKQAFSSEKSQPIQSVKIKPSTKTGYSKPVYILQSGLSTSAAETFALAAKALPNVTIIGENSQGTTASSITRSLPFSGITLHIPSNIHSDFDGKSYEKIGLTPDVLVPDSRLEGVDSIMLKALELSAEYLCK